MPFMNRSFDIVDVAQGSEAWRLARAGRVTGSVAAAVMAKEDTALKNDLRLRLAVERMTGMPMPPEFSSRHTEHGSLMEPLARVEVERKTRLLFSEAGFLRDRDKMIGFSPDGYWGRFDGLLEVKCPKSTTHTAYLKAGKLPAAYRWQVVHGMYVTGAGWCVFASFDDRMPDGLQLFTKEVLAKDLPLEEYERELTAFLVSVEALEYELKQLQEKEHGKERGR